MAMTVRSVAAKLVFYAFVYITLGEKNKNRRSWGLGRDVNFHPYFLHM